MRVDLLSRVRHRPHGGLLERGVLAVVFGILSHQGESRCEIFQVMQTEHGESMQCLQFSCSLAFFCQISVREQNPDVMCNTSQQIAIIRAIGFSMNLLAQRHKGRELPLGTDGETERHA